jgi:hypothetical protein
VLATRVTAGDPLFGAVQHTEPAYGALRETARFGFRTRYGYDDVAPAPTATWPTNGSTADCPTGLPAEQTRICDEMIPASRTRFAW